MINNECTDYSFVDYFRKNKNINENKINLKKILHS